jgi:hypothetical protein
MHKPRDLKRTASVIALVAAMAAPAIVTYSTQAAAEPVIVQAQLQQPVFMPDSIIKRRTRENARPPSASGVQGGTRSDRATGVNEEWERRYEGVTGDGSQLPGAGVDGQRNEAFEQKIKSKQDPFLTDGRTTSVITRGGSPHNPDDNDPEPTDGNDPDPTNDNEPPVDCPPPGMIVNNMCIIGDPEDIFDDPDPTGTNDPDPTGTNDPPIVIDPPVIGDPYNPYNPYTQPPIVIDPPIITDPPITNDPYNPYNPYTQPPVVDCPPPGQIVNNMCIISDPIDVFDPEDPYDPYDPYNPYTVQPPVIGDPDPTNDNEPPAVS